MTDSYLIETSDETAGIAVQEIKGLRFYASKPLFSELEGKIFSSVFDIRRAVELHKDGQNTKLC